MRRSLREIGTSPGVKKLRRIAGRISITGNILGQGWAGLKQSLLTTKLGRTIPVRLGIRVIQELGDDDATHMAASVSYYAILSLFPLILGLSAIIGTVADSPGRQEEIIDFTVGFLPGSEAFVRDSITGAVKFRAALGLVSILSLIWAGSAVFGSITRAVNRAWDVGKDPPFYKNKPRQLAMAVGVAVLFALSISLASLFQWATSIEISGKDLENLLGGGIVTGILKLPALLISFAIFAGIYKMLPNARTHWRYIWVGALVAGVLFEGGKTIFLWYLENFAQYDQVYGNIASVIALMVWTYFSAFILILGAEVASEYGRLRRGLERGKAILMQS